MKRFSRLSFRLFKKYKWSLKRLLDGFKRFFLSIKKVLDVLWEFVKAFRRF